LFTIAWRRRTFCRKCKLEVVDDFIYGQVRLKIGIRKRDAFYGKRALTSSEPELALP